MIPTTVTLASAAWTSRSHATRSASGRLSTVAAITTTVTRVAAAAAARTR